jgi:hypothetical protein
MMRTTAALGALLLAFGCGPKVLTEYKSDERLPRPNDVVVQHFSVDPGDVQLDRSVLARLLEMGDQREGRAGEVAVGREVAKAFTPALVKELRGLGMPARAADGVPRTIGQLLISGQFISIDQGDETERVVIGLGIGGSKVRADVQVWDVNIKGPIRVLEFETEAKSMFMPGMLETMGAGAVAGRAAVSLGVGIVSETAGQEWSDSVEAEAKRSAKAVAKKLAEFFLQEGWVTQEAVDNASSPLP